MLLDLRIDSKNSKTRLEDFKGQLERGDKNRRSHWQLFLKVEHQTTAVAVAKTGNITVNAGMGAAIAEFVRYTASNSNNVPRLGLLLASVSCCVVIQ